ncbi:CsbD-like protein [Nocardia tenerifensis]|uniref:CsbD-like protein n=1 Tax=Nocardia tenerifensis TaxID=228006 RepID=A0A318KA08_9NOCA|nr:CsbD family protein [Nocardia tenerifensis]PXX61532.1 CsbD-like protein [Nocardia tenerifensis]
MSRLEDKLAHQVQAARGNAKKYLGRAVGNRRLEAQGRRKQASGNMKRAAGKLRDAFKR